MGDDSSDSDENQAFDFEWRDFFRKPTPEDYAEVKEIKKNHDAGNGATFKSTALVGGLGSLFSNKATWVKMAYPSVEHAALDELQQMPRVVLFYCALGKVVVSPTRCQAIPVPFLRWGSKERTHEFIGKVELNPRTYRLFGSKGIIHREVIRITRSHPGNLLCDSCAFTYGHLGPYCIHKPKVSWIWI